MNKQANLEAVQELSDEIASLTDLVDEVVLAIGHDPEKAELFAVMLLDTVAAAAKDVGMPMGGGMGMPPMPMGPPVDMGMDAPMDMPEAGLPPLGPPVEEIPVVGDEEIELPGEPEGMGPDMGLPEDEIPEIDEDQLEPV
jgi:hypothetical protein